MSIDKAFQIAVTSLFLLASADALGQRRPPFGSDAGLLEARVRETIERKIAPPWPSLPRGRPS